jgi:hypothetical protein
MLNDEIENKSQLKKEQFELTSLNLSNLDHETEIIL